MWRGWRSTPSWLRHRALPPISTPAIDAAATLAPCWAVLPGRGSDAAREAGRGWRCSLLCRHGPPRGKASSVEPLAAAWPPRRPSFTAQRVGNTSRVTTARSQPEIRRGALKREACRQGGGSVTVTAASRGCSESEPSTASLSRTRSATSPASISAPSSWRERVQI